MARIYPICSSSKGNSTYIGSSESGILVDCGCSYKALRESLALNNMSIENVQAVFITHEHIDHIKALQQLTKHTKIPVFASTKTLDFLVQNNCVCSTANLCDANENEWSCDEFTVTSFHTPHDSVESVGYTITYSDKKLAVCTDLGNVTEEVERNLLGCDALLLESNYDYGMLQANPRYPYYLKKRIASDHGHLSNTDSAHFIERLIKSGTTRVILGHLSQENNTPQTAFENAVNHLKTCGIVEERDYLLNVAPVMTSGKYITV